jgi:hypothetical protein
MTGIEPALSAWEADVLPLNYIRTSAKHRPGGTWAILTITCYRKAQLAGALLADLGFEASNRYVGSSLAYRRWNLSPNDWSAGATSDGPTVHPQLRNQDEAAVHRSDCDNPGHQGSVR